MFEKPELTKGLIRQQQMLQSLAQVEVQKYISYGRDSTDTDERALSARDWE